MASRTLVFEFRAFRLPRRAKLSQAIEFDASESIAPSVGPVKDRSDAPGDLATRSKGALSHSISTT